MFDFLSPYADVIVSGASVAFIVALIPALRALVAPPLRTSAIIAIGLTFMAVAMVSVDLYWSAFTTAAQAALWFALLAKGMYGVSSDDLVEQQIREDLSSELRALSTSALNNKTQRVAVSYVTLAEAADALGGIR